MEKSISRRLSEFAHNLKFEDLPENVVFEIKRFLYDSIGCALGGTHTKDVNILRDIYKEIGGKPEATVIGFGDKIPAVNAAFVNSQAVRALDFNDIYWMEDPSHPSDLIPAALAAGELSGASMRDVFTAIALAYEFEQRLCLVAKPGIRERKWHHATITQFVSPIVAGKVLGLTVDEMVNAIGISGSHNHSLGCVAAGQLTMMKNTVDPMAVQSGVLAALMAKRGFTGTEKVFEGKEGYFDAHLGWNAKSEESQPVTMKGREHVEEWRWDISPLFDDLGNRWMILECGMKAFPTEALTHSHISAVLNVMRENNLVFSDVEEIRITAVAQAVDILFDPEKYRPESRETADHSLPYCIAAAVVDGKITTDSFSDEKLKDPKIWEVIDKIKGEASQKFQELFPEKQPSKAVIKSKSGIEFSSYVEYPKGDPREPMTMEDLENKFNSLANKHFDSVQLAKLKEDIFSCENLSAREFMEKLAN